MGLSASAQENGSKPDWLEKIRSEKVAFITMELELGVEEAQAFWPVYNEVDALRLDRFRTCMKSLKALKAAAEAGEPTESLLKAYLDAKQASDSVDNEVLPRFLSVLSAEKTARLYLAEEKFRHNQIARLGDRQEKGRRKE